MNCPLSSTRAGISILPERREGEGGEEEGEEEGGRRRGRREWRSGGERGGGREGKEW